jgi:ribosomal protein L29
MEITELRNLNTKELLDRCEELKRNIFILKSTVAIEKKDKNAREIRGHKKEIARIRTILSECEQKIALGELSE